MPFITPKDIQVSVASANNVNNAVNVRVFNNAAAVGVITISYANGLAYANCTVAGYSETLIRKTANDTITLANGLASRVSVW